MRTRLALRRRLRSLVETLACAAGLHHVARWLNRRRLLIVCYHGVCEDDCGEKHWLLLPRKEFLEQINYLRRHYRCMNVDDAVVALQQGELRAPTACVTFDDGYRNNVEVALPILRAASVPATIYLATGYVGSSEMLWTTEIELAIRNSEASRVDLTLLGLGVCVLSTSTERRMAAAACCERLKRLRLDERVAIVNRLRGALAPSAHVHRRAFAFLDWHNVRTMEATGIVRFGAHTVHHDILSRDADDRVRSEVSGSMSAVRERVHRPSRTFAYPNGRRIDFDDRAKSAIAAAGGIAGLSTIEGLNDQQTDALELRRIVVGREVTLANFKLRTSGVFAVVKHLLSTFSRKVP